MCFKALSVHPQVLCLKHLPRKCGSTAVGNASALQPGAAAGNGRRKASWLTLSSMNMMPIQIFASRQKLGQPAHSGGQPGRITQSQAPPAPRCSQARAARRQRREQHRAHSAWLDRTRLRPASRVARPDLTAAGQPQRSAARRRLAPLPLPRANGVQDGRRKKGDPRARRQESDAIQRHHAQRLQCSRGAAPGVAAPSITGVPSPKCALKSHQIRCSIGYNDVEAVPYVFPQIFFRFFFFDFF
jgi:hypothetical protein